MAGDLVPPGHIFVTDNDVVVENRRLRVEIETERAARVQCEREAALNREAVAALRRQLSPLFRALQAVFGEIDAAGIGDMSAGDLSGGATSPREVAVWASWKQKLGAGAAKVIDALLLHGELNTQQLAIAIGMHRTSIPKIVYTLNKAGLINKNSGRFSLKAL